MRFEHVSLRYARRSDWVLTNVSLTLEAGQAAVVLGRNGAGKTTLLSAMVGLLPAARGKIVDRPRRVGWVPERFPANQPYRVRPYLVDMGQVQGLSAREAGARVSQWAARLNLDPFLDVRLAEVSKGTAQKVGLIQALMARPDLLVLDEPWEGLDAATRDEMPAIITEVLSYGGSVLVSDHLGQVERLSGAQHWHVQDGRVSVEPPNATGAAPTVSGDPHSGGAYGLGAGPGGGRRWVIGVAVSESDVDLAMSRLRDEGYDVLGARPEPSTVEEEVR